MRMVAAFKCKLSVQVGWLGLRVGSHAVHSSDEK